MTETITPTKLFAWGKVISAKDGLVVFNPAGTSYELHLACPTFDGPLNKPVKAMIYLTARKIYTVPSGGNFVSPIFGPPRMVQGMVRAADERSLVVHAGCPFYVDLPAADSGIDLSNGPISVSRMVNVVCLPGARMEFV
jgi:hypothetical protein